MTDHTDEDGGNGLVWKMLAGLAAFVTATAAAVGLLINIVSGHADLRSTVRDLQTRIEISTQRLNNIDVRLKELDTNGSRANIGTEVMVREMKKDLDEMKDMWRQHREETFELLPEHHKFKKRSELLDKLNKIQ